MRLTDDSLVILDEIEADARESMTIETEEQDMAYWIHWHEASGAIHAPIPFADRGTAENYIEARLREWASALEHGTGSAGWWNWGTARRVATLYRGDYDIELGHFTITKEEPENTPD